MAKLSSRAFSSLNRMFPYVSNRVGGVGLPIVVVHEAVCGHVAANPPTSTVAVMDCPPNPVVSTVIVLVPSPLVIRPADTVHV